MNSKCATINTWQHYHTVHTNQLAEIKVDGLSQKEFSEFIPLMRTFTDEYAAKSPTESDTHWLSSMMMKELPNEKPSDVVIISQDIVTAIQDHIHLSKQAANARVLGQQPEEWVADNLSALSQELGTQEFGNRLAALDGMLHHSNQEMMTALTTKSGTINMNKNLHGFIAEQDLVSTFNQNAQLANSAYEARLMNPEGANFGKNSVDIGIYEKSSGHLTQRYQVKAGGTESNTIGMIKQGNYNNQRLIVPKGQVTGVKEHFSKSRSISDCLEAPDGTKSAPLDRDKCKAWQKDAQEGKGLPTRNWTEFDNKALAIHLGKEVAFAGLAGAAMGAGLNMAEKALSGQKIEANEVIKAAIHSGADAGIKAATAGALTVASKKGILPVLAGVGAKSIATIACYAIESMKIIGDYLSGIIDGKEAAARFLWLGATTFIASKVLGIGALAGVVLFTPIGTAVAVGVGLVAGVMAFGSEICEVAASIVEGVSDVVSDVWSGITSVVSDAVSAIGSIFDSIFG